MTPDVAASTLPIRSVRLGRATDFAAAAERIAEIAQGEGFVIAGAYPQSEAAGHAATGDLPPALAIELDAPALTAALLAERPDVALLLPWRIHLVRRDDGLFLSALDPALLHALVPDPSAELYKRMSWLEVALEIVLEVLA